MEPLLIAGMHALVRPVAPDEPLIDGGMYCIEWDDPHAAAAERAYKERFGIPLTERIVITKFLRFICGEWVAQCKDSIAKLNGVVVGMVVGVISLSAAAGCSTEESVHARLPLCGNPFDPESGECAQIGLNAATITIINNSNSGGSGLTGFTGLTSLGFVVNPPSPAADCTVIVTATVSARQTVGTVGQMKVLVRFSDDGVTYVSASQELPIASAAYQAYTMQWQFAHSAANAGHGQAGIYVDNTGVSTNSMDWNQATIQAEYIIR
jgi:hypothetical protein